MLVLLVLPVLLLWLELKLPNEVFDDLAGADVLDLCDEKPLRMPPDDPDGREPA